MATARTRTENKPAPRKKPASRKSGPKGAYTDPELRERLKDEIMAGDRGGDKGEWSARKAQLLTREYEKAGGGYTSEKRTESQQHLSEWTEEDWTTSDALPADRPDGKTRYLPREAWAELSPEERREANETKREGDREGHQHVANPEPAKKARKRAEARHERDGKS